MSTESNNDHDAGAAAGGSGPLFPFVLGGLLHDVNNSLAILYALMGLSEILPVEKLAPLLADARVQARWQHVAHVVSLMQSLCRESYAPAPDAAQSAVVDRLGEMIGRMGTAEPQLQIECACDPEVDQSGVPASLVLFIAGEILQNAVQACAGGAATIRLALAIDLAGRTLSISCLDDGKGFTAEQLEAIRAQRLQVPESGAGSGYGLYFIKEITNRLEGSVLVSNNESGGARMEVLLPCQPLVGP